MKTQTQEQLSSGFKLNVGETLDKASLGNGAIVDLVNAFNGKLVKAIQEIADDFITGQNKMLIGYDENGLDNRILTIKHEIEILNSIQQKYLLLFPQEKASVDLLDKVNQLLPDARKVSNEFEAKLKRLYLEANNISIPSFPNIRMDKLVELYEYPLEVEATIQAIVEEADRRNLQHAPGKWNYLYDKAKGELVLTQAHIDKERERFAIYITTEQVAEIINLHLFCVGLDNARGPGYSFKELPEIDYRIMSKIKVYPNGHLMIDVLRLEEYLKVNSHRLPVVRFKNKGGAPQIVKDPNQKDIAMSLGVGPK